MAEAATEKGEVAADGGVKVGFSLLQLEVVAFQRLRSMVQQPPSDTMLMLWYSEAYACNCFTQAEFKGE